MKKVLLLIYLFVQSTGFSQGLVTWNNKPVNMQMFARESNDSADVRLAGTVNMPDYDSLFVELYRNGVLINRISRQLDFNDGIAQFSITHRIKAELSEYKTKAYLREDNTLTLIDTSDSLVAGDIYIIMGQSNAQVPDTNVSYRNEYCRTFGIQTPNTNRTNYDRKDTNWVRSSAKYNGFIPIDQSQPYNVGAWGMLLQKSIKESYGIPTCIINGAVHSTTIANHLRNNLKATDSSTIYGRTLYRTLKSGLLSKVKAIFWFQGESDVISPTYGSYAVKFDSLYNSWKSDYAGLGKIIVIQTRPLACNGLSDYAQELRETQRQFSGIYSDVQVVATTGIGWYTPDPPSYNCHFFYKGYEQFAGILLSGIAPMFYGSTDTMNIKSPNISRAWYTGSDKKKIAILFNGSSPAVVPADSLGNSIKNYFYLNKVPGFTSGKISSVTISGDTLFLNLNSSSTATNISYIPDIYTSNGYTIYDGPWIRNSRGLGMLTFDQFPIMEPPTQINIRTIIEGLYSPGLNASSRGESVTVYLRQSFFPYRVVDSSRAKIDSITFTGTFNFLNAANGVYYIAMKYLNTIETWSKTGGENIVKYGPVLFYDFTDSVNHAFGGNQKLLGGKFCIYSGDVNQSGSVDLTDIISIYNDSQNFISGGETASDLNGDHSVNLNDILICYNNSEGFVRVVRP